MAIRILMLIFAFTLVVNLVLTLVGFFSGVNLYEKYGKQILNCFFDYLFGELNAKKVICSCHPDNIPSKKLQQSCGMKFTHTEEFTRKKDNVTYNAEYYAITREEWENLREFEKQ